MHINVPYNFSEIIQKTALSDAAVEQRHSFSAQENANHSDCLHSTNRQVYTCHIPSKYLVMTTQMSYNNYIPGIY